MSPLVLVTGASGYVGGRLVPDLLAAGLRLRCLARTPAKLSAVPWQAQVEVVAGTVAGDLTEAMRDVDIAVYLVHSIGASPDWQAREVHDADNFAAAAATAGVKRILYLGGLGRAEDQLSPHLRSRQSVGARLAAHGVEVIELRAGVVLGSGSASFEMLRYLVDVLPVMITPRWVGTKCQPIAIADVVAYLRAAVFAAPQIHGIFEIGGPDVLTYAELMQAYADAASLPRRRLIPVPFLTPRLSAHWVGLVTPVPATLATELVESLVNEVTLLDDRASRTFTVNPMSVREALDRALLGSSRGEVPSHFTDADFGPFQPVTTDPTWAGGTVLRDRRELLLQIPAPDLFAAVCRIGGVRGWYGGTFLWRVRGALDLVAGGPGLRRGRRDQNELRPGEPLDFWRVEEIVGNQRLRLRAEMLLPGAAWLTFEVTPTAAGSRIIQIAEFRPHGLLGRLYWFGVAPFHRLVFPALLNGIAADARELAELRSAGRPEHDTGGSLDGPDAGE
jgi:uncharacterized protein YbjT (DUF2867 family)